MSCPRCQTINPSYVASCYVCGFELGGAAAAGPAPAPVADAPPVAREPGRTSGLAIAGFVLSLFGVLGLVVSVLFAIPVVVALVLSIRGVQAIKSSGGTLRGRGLAIAGIAISTAFLLVLLVGVASLVNAS